MLVTRFDSSHIANMKKIKTAKITESLHGYDLRDVRYEQSAKDVAWDIAHVLDLVHAWEEWGCSFLYYGGVLTASNGKFTARIDLGKGCYRQGSHSMPSGYAQFSGLTYAERVDHWIGDRRTHYDSVLLHYLKDYL